MPNGIARMLSTAWKVSSTKFFLVRIFPHLDWTRLHWRHFSAFIRNFEKISHTVPLLTLTSKCRLEDLLSQGTYSLDGINNTGFLAKISSRNSNHQIIVLTVRITWTLSGLLSDFLLERSTSMFIPNFCRYCIFSKIDFETKSSKAT